MKLQLNASTTTPFDFNATDGHETDFRQPDWLIPCIVNIFLTIVTFFILISLICYGIKTGKWKAIQKTEEKLNAGLIYTFLTACSVMCILRLIISQIHMNVGFNEGEDELCRAVLSAGFVAYALVLYFGVLFLWFRQRVFYTNKMLSFKSTKFVQVLSFSSIIIITIGAVGYSIFALVPRKFKASKTGCLEAPEHLDLVGYGVYSTILLIAAQVMLLCLFIYPLIKINSLCYNPFKYVMKNIRKENRHSLSKQKNSVSSITVNTVMTTLEPSCTGSDNQSSVANSIDLRKNSFSHSPPSDGIRLIMRKTVFFAVMSTGLDVFAQLFSKFSIDPNGHRRMSYLIYDTAALANLLFLILSFVTSKKILMAACHR